MATGLPSPTRSASHRSSTTHPSSARESITLVADDLSVGLVTVGGAGRITFINRAIERMLGYHADELVGEPLDVIVPPRMRGTYTEALRHFLATGEGAVHAWTGVRLSAMHRAGHEVPLEVSFSDSIRDGERHLTGVLRDLSVESEAAAALRLSDARFHAMTEASPFGTFVMDPDGACIYTNRAYHAITGSEPHDAFGAGWRLLVHPDDLERALGFSASVIAERTARSGEVRYRRPNGDVVWTTVRLAPIVVDDLVIGCLGTLEDITQQRAARELERDIGARIQEMFLHGDLPPVTPAYSVGVVAEPSHRLELVSCGHAHVLHVRGSDGTGRLIESANVRLGFAPGNDVQTTRAETAEGDVVVLYPKGLTEARSPDGRVFGVKRVMDVVRAYRREPATVIARAVRRAVVRFTESLSAADDLTCIVVRLEAREAAAVEPQQWEADAVFPSLAHLRSFIRRFCERLNPRPDAGWENALVLATHEAAANVVRHDSIARRLFVTARVEGTAVEVRLSHDGAAFAPSRVVEPALEARAEHGHGLFLIRRNVDATRYGPDARQRPGVTLHKHLPPRVPDAPGDLS